jgi:4-oxalocrotonate tautomerase
MPVIIVEMWQGRTLEQKKQLAEGITAEFIKIGVPAGQVQIIFKIIQKNGDGRNY